MNIVYSPGGRTQIPANRFNTIVKAVFVVRIFLLYRLYGSREVVSYAACPLFVRKNFDGSQR